MQLREAVKNPVGKASSKYDWHKMKEFAPGLYVVERCPMDLPTSITKKLQDAGKEIPEEVYIWKVGSGSQQLQTCLGLKSDHKGHESLLAALDPVIDPELRFDALCVNLGVEYESEVLSIMRRMMVAGTLDLDAFKAEAKVEVEREED
jgi:hypothetical protein